MLANVEGHLLEAVGVVAGARLAAPVRQHRLGLLDLVGRCGGGSPRVGRGRLEEVLQLLVRAAGAAAAVRSVLLLLMMVVVVSGRLGLLIRHLPPRVASRTSSLSLSALRAALPRTEPSGSFALCVRRVYGSREGERWGEMADAGISRRFSCAVAAAADY